MQDAWCVYSSPPSFVQLATLARLLQGMQSGVVLHPSALPPAAPPPPLLFNATAMAEAGGPGPVAAQYAQKHAMDVHPVRLAYTIVVLIAGCSFRLAGFVRYVLYLWMSHCMRADAKHQGLSGPL